MKRDVAQHNGVFRRRLSVFEGVALIVSGTVGAGVLGIPYAVSKVGVAVGLTYIVVFGLLVMMLNLMLGLLTAQPGSDLQLAGLAGKYLGPAGKGLMTVVAYFSGFGVLLAYIIGVGQILAELFAGSVFWWSVGFFLCASVFVVLGMQAVRVVDFYVTLAIFAIVVLIVVWSAPHMQIDHVIGVQWAEFFFPYGVILFAFSGATSIPEAHSIMHRRDGDFKHAIVYSSLITIFLYSLFALVVVGVTGFATTEIATIGLGRELGQIMLIAGNLFAIFAMSTGFIMSGSALRDSMVWDFKINRGLSNILALGVPLVLFLVGARQFVAALGIVGGVFVSLQMSMIVLMFWRAKQKGVLKRNVFGLYHTALLAVILLCAFMLGGVYSIWNLF